jgi:tRNA1Val (adenine37-N6)-methyltransferase
LDAVVTNPPYFRRQGAIASNSAERYLSRHESTADIRDFVKAAASMLKRGGSLYLVHRPDRLADIMSAMREAGTEPKYLQLVVPKRGEAPNIVLISGIKGAGPELHVLPQIEIRTEDGEYTAELLRVYERNS